MTESNIVEQTQVVLDALRGDDKLGMPYNINSSSGNVSIQMRAGAAGFVAWINEMKGVQFRAQSFSQPSYTPRVGLIANGNFRGVHLDVVCVFRDPLAMSLVYVEKPTLELALLLAEEGLR